MSIEQVELRLGRNDDAQIISTMARDLIEKGLGWSWTPGRVSRRVLHPECSTVVACNNDRLVAFALMIFGDDIGHLDLLAVAPAFQRQGLGRSLLGWLETSARVAGLARIDVEMRSNNRPARQFYRSLGFRQTGSVPNYYSGQETATLMTLSLRPVPEA